MDRQHHQNDRMERRRSRSAEPQRRAVRNLSMVTRRFPELGRPAGSPKGRIPVAAASAPPSPALLRSSTALQRTPAPAAPQEPTPTTQRYHEMRQLSPDDVYTSRTFRFVYEGTVPSSIANEWHTAMETGIELIVHGFRLDIGRYRCTVHNAGAMGETHFVFKIYRVSPRAADFVMLQLYSYVLGRRLGRREKWTVYAACVQWEPR